MRLVIFLIVLFNPVLDTTTKIQARLQGAVWAFCNQGQILLSLNHQKLPICKLKKLLQKA